MKVPTRGPNNETDLNLYEEIMKFLIQSNVSDAGIHTYDTDSFVVDCKDKPAALQKVLINMFFSRLIFMNVTDIPQSIRLALSSVGSELEWLSVVKLVTLPFMFQHQLLPLSSY